MSLLVEELAERIARQTGVTMDRARVIARANVAPSSGQSSAPQLAPSVLAEQDGRAEKAQQNDIRKLWLTLGGKVWDTSAVTRAKITPGIADLYLTLPRWSFAMWWESKSAEAVTRKDGGRSESQLEFAEHTQMAGVAYGSGTFRDFVQWLLEHASDLEWRDEIFAAIEKAGLSDRMART